VGSGYCCIPLARVTCPQGASVARGSKLPPHAFSRPKDGAKFTSQGCEPWKPPAKRNVPRNPGGRHQGPIIRPYRSYPKLIDGDGRCCCVDHAPKDTPADPLAVREVLANGLETSHWPLHKRRSKGINCCVQHCVHPQQAFAAATPALCAAPPRP